VVVTATSSTRADIGIDGGRIVMIGAVVPSAQREIDASEQLVLPGCVDMHSHLAGSSSLHRIDGFDSGTRAAAAGGITTICDFAFQEVGDGLRAAVERTCRAAETSLVDYALHVVLADPTPAALAEIPELAADGFAGLKIFMPSAAFAEQTVEYIRAMRIAAQAGVLTAVHAEDRSVVSYCTAELLSSGRTGVEWFPAARPPLAEELAVRRAIAYSELTGAPLYFMHLSARGSIDALSSARAKGLPIAGETRPLYLFLTRREFERADGAKFVGNPPLREAEDVDAMWNALRVGVISTVGSDHTPYPLASKMDPTHTFATIPAGVTNLETVLPMLYSEGVLKGRLGVNRLVDIVATSPARLAGLLPRKGQIAIGADADIVVFDPKKTRTIRSSEMQSNADYDPFEGRSVTGWPSTTLSRGDIVYMDGKVVGTAGRGQLQRRARFASIT